MPSTQPGRGAIAHRVSTVASTKPLAHRRIVAVKGERVTRARGRDDAVEVGHRTHRLPVDLHDDESAPHRRARTTPPPDRRGRRPRPATEAGVSIRRANAGSRSRTVSPSGASPAIGAAAGAARRPRLGDAEIARPLRQLDLRRTAAVRPAAAPAAPACPAAGPRCRGSARRWSRRRGRRPSRMMSYGLDPGALGRRSVADVLHQRAARRPAG